MMKNQAPSLSSATSDKIHYLGNASDVLERVSDAFIALDRNWLYTYVNAKAAQLLQRRAADLIGKHLWTEFSEMVGQPFYAAYHRALADQVFVELEVYYAPFDQWFENRIYPAEDGVLVFFHDITERKRTAQLIQGQSALMERIARNEPLREVLVALTLFIEAQAAELLCSVLLLDNDGVHVRSGAAPSLPDAFNKAIDGQPIGPRAGSCGTAAFRREPVIVEDIATDPLWIDYKDFALAHELRACWSTPILDPSGRVLGTFAIYFRRTARPSEWHQGLINIATHIAAIAIMREHAATAFQTSEERYRNTLDNTLEGCQLVGFDWKYLYINRAAASQNRRPSEALLGKTMMEVWPGIEGSAAFALLLRCMTERVPLHQEINFVFPEGESGWFDVRCQPVPEGIFILSIDITDRRRAESVLRDSEERFRQIAENIEEVFWMTDVDKNHVLYVSPGYEKIWGISRESLYTEPRSWLESVHPEDRARILHAATTKQVSGQYDEVYRVMQTGGNLRWVRDRAFPVRDQAGNVFRLVGTVQDISVRKQAEMRLQLQYAVTTALTDATSVGEIYRRILDILGEGLHSVLGELWRVDRSAKVIRCAETWAPPHSKFKSFAEGSRNFSFASGQGLLASVWATGQAQWSNDTANDPRMQRKEEAARLGLHGWIGFPIKIRSEVLGVVGLFFNFEMQAPDTEMLAMLGALGVQIGLFVERKQLAEQFRQAQKMEAIGTLAGGIAHDFNNVLAAVNGFTELAKLEVGESNPAATEHLDAVLQGTRRAIDLVRQILAFSRQQELEKKSIQLWRAVREALKLLRATIPTTIDFNVSLDPDVPNVLADATQVHQVVMNLFTNAAHAMKDRGGQLTVRLERFQVDEEMVSALPDLRPGLYLRLSVTDTGHGMDEGTLSRIFEPFFTTKAPGEGTGLGLSVVHGIMQSHQGGISVYSQPGEGTTFHLFFPAHVGAEAEVPPSPTEIRQGHGQRVLYIDDEPQLAAVGRKILERLGYKADARSNPLEALELVRAQPKAYDLIITDQTMPGLLGTDLAEKIHALRPDLPIILTTGYSATLDGDSFRSLGIRKLLYKPLSIDALGTAVGHVFAEVKSL